MGMMGQINLAFNNHAGTKKQQIIPDNSIKTRELTSALLIPSMFCLVGAFSRKVPNFSTFIAALITWKIREVITSAPIHVPVFPQVAWCRISDQMVGICTAYFVLPGIFCGSNKA